MYKQNSGVLMIVGPTVIDGASERAKSDQAILIEAGRIKAICSRPELIAPSGAKVIDATGKFVIPGLMNANVHLFGMTTLGKLTADGSRWEQLIAEAAQVALKNGLTTVFDTWGPRRFLMAVRDRIDRGEIPGSRVFCAGNIIGFDGPFSRDFLPDAAAFAGVPLSRRVNAIFVENVGRHLMWLPPEEVGREVCAYIERGIDFVKYASNDHFPGAFLAFSPKVQEIIVKEAHEAGISAQAHSMSVEGLRVAIEAGCDLVTHCNITGPVEIPDSTLELFAERSTGAVIFPFTRRRFETILRSISDMEKAVWVASDANARKLIACGAKLLLANDGSILPRECMVSSVAASSWITTGGEDNLATLDTGHFAWFKAMEEKGCGAMAMLQAATRNIAIAYGKDRDLGSLQAGKIADMLILDRNPLLAAENYRSIFAVIKDGAVVNRESLPVEPVMTGQPAGPAEEESSYRPFIPGTALPICPFCGPG